MCGCVSVASFYTKPGIHSFNLYAIFTTTPRMANLTIQPKYGIVLAIK